MYPCRGATSDSTCAASARKNCPEETRFPALSIPILGNRTLVLDTQARAHVYTLQRVLELARVDTHPNPRAILLELQPPDPGRPHGSVEDVVHGVIHHAHGTVLEHLIAVERPV